MSRRTAALAGSFALLLAGCGGATHAQQTRTVTVTPSAPGTTTSAGTATSPITTTGAPASTPATPAPAGTAARSANSTGDAGGTRSLHVSPSAGSGWTVQDAGSDIECTGSSAYADSAGTYSCGGTAQDAYACVADSDPAHVLCVTDPWTRVATRWSVQGSLPGSGKESTPLPLGIQLSDGSRWKPRTGGAVPPASENSAIAYYCATGCGENDVLVGPPNLGDGPILDTSHATWTIRRGQMGLDKAASKASTATVTTAWFLRAPSPQSGAGRTSGTTTSGGSSGGGGDFGPVKNVSITINRAGDADKLPDSLDLRSFARRQLKTVNDEPGCSYGFTVTQIDARSTAIVDVFAPGCGGSEEFWGVKNGHWVKAYDGQAVPLCSELRATGATLNPRMVSCQDPSDAKPHPYRP